ICIVPSRTGKTDCFPFASPLRRSDTSFGAAASRSRLVGRRYRFEHGIAKHLSARPARLVVVLSLEAIAFDLGDEVRSRNAELFGQLGLVPMRPDESVVNQVALERLDRVLEGSWRNRARERLGPRDAVSIAHALGQ